VSGSFMDSAAVLTFVAIPCEVTWSYCVGGAVFLIGLVKMFLRGDWQKARGFDKLILFGPLFYAVPVAAFGTEHYTLTKGMASIIPVWIPWHQFYRWRTKPGDGDRSPPRSQRFRLDVFPFRGADAPSGLATKSGKSVWADHRAAGNIVQRRRYGAGRQP